MGCRSGVRGHHPLKKSGCGGFVACHKETNKEKEEEGKAEKKFSEHDKRQSENYLCLEGLLYILGTIFHRYFAR